MTDHMPSADQQARRADILRRMELVMGELPGGAGGPPPKFEVLEQRDHEGVLARKLAYAPEAGDEVRAWLLLPRDLKETKPAVLCLHQTTDIGKDEPAGLGGKRNLHYALELAQRGYVTLSPDYVTFGEYRVAACPPGYASGTMKGLFNHMRAVDLLRSLPEIDGRRIGCIGHSLGGHNTLFLAAFDQRLAAAVTCCGFTTWRHYAPMQGGDLHHWAQDRYMPRIAHLYGNDPARMPFEFEEVLEAICPRGLFICAPVADDNFDIQGVRQTVKIIQPLYEKFGVASHLVAEYPDCGHDFPPASRQAAYAFLDRLLH